MKEQNLDSYFISAARFDLCFVLRRGGTPPLRLLCWKPYRFVNTSPDPDVYAELNSSVLSPNLEASQGSPAVLQPKCSGEESSKDEERGTIKE